MKVFNLTDISTAELERRGLVGQTFAVGKALLAPGEQGEIDDQDAVSRAGIQELISFGALAVEEPPPGYRVAKEKAAKAPPPAAPPVAPSETMEAPEEPKRRR